MGDLNLSAPLTSPETISNLASGASEVLREVPVPSLPPEFLPGPESLAARSIGEFISDSMRDSFEALKQVSGYPGIIKRGVELSGEVSKGVQVGVVASAALGNEVSQEIIRTLATAPAEFVAGLPPVPEFLAEALRAEATWFNSLTPEAQMAVAASATAFSVVLGVGTRVFPRERLAQMAREFVGR